MKDTPEGKYHLQRRRWFRWRTVCTFDTWLAASYAGLSLTLRTGGRFRVVEAKEVSP